jgi:hypothetical protein
MHERSSSINAKENQTYYARLQIEPDDADGDRERRPA